jgi:hypothetical protein
MDFNGQPFNNPYFKQIDWNYSTAGGFNGSVFTISSYSNLVFIGGSFTQAIATPFGNPELDNFQYGALWNCAPDGNSGSNPAFQQIGGGLSTPINCSDFNPSNNLFCLGYSGNNLGYNNYLEFLFYSPSSSIQASQTPTNPIVSLLVSSYTGAWLVYTADNVGYVYENNILLGQSFTSGINGICVFSSIGKVVFATTSFASDWGFYTWTSSQTIDCPFPTLNTFKWFGSPNNNVGIRMYSVGAYFTLTWDGTNYQNSGQYYNVAPYT